MGEMEGYEDPPAQIKPLVENTASWFWLVFPRWRVTCVNEQARHVTSTKDELSYSEVQRIDQMHMTQN